MAAGRKWHPEMMERRRRVSCTKRRMLCAKINDIIVWYLHFDYAAAFHSAVLCKSVNS